MLNVNEPETRGVALALQSMTDDVGKGLGPFLVSWLIASIGRKDAFNVAVGGWLPAGVLLLSLVFCLERDEKAMQGRLKRVAAAQSPPDPGDTGSRGVGKATAASGLHPAEVALSVGLGDEPPYQAGAGYVAPDLPPDRRSYGTHSPLAEREMVEYGRHGAALPPIAGQTPPSSSNHDAAASTGKALRKSSIPASQGVSPYEPELPPFPGETLAVGGMQPKSTTTSFL